MVGDFIFVIFYGGVLVLMGIFARWMLSREEFSIEPEIENKIQADRSEGL